MSKTVMKSVCRDALADLAKLCNLASDHGLTVRVSEVTSRKSKKRRVVTLHVMFDDEAGIRVLDYWPGSGRIWCQLTRSKGSVADWWEALDEAARINAKRLGFEAS